MGEVGAPLRMSPQVAEHGEEAPMTWPEWRGMSAWPWGMAGSRAWAEGCGRVQVLMARVVQSAVARTETDPPLSKTPNCLENRE
jgi:hypothetical protein